MPSLRSVPLTPEILAAEPPPSRAESSYVVGQDPQGRWVALESHGLGGGLFRSREAAVQFAAAETGRRAGAVRLAAEPLLVAL